MAAWAQRTAEDYFSLACSIDARSGARSDVSARAYEIAATMGHVAAEFNVGVCCALGEGRPVDLAQARVHYESAAARGYANAQYNLAVMLQAGEGGDVDIAGAERLYCQAAASGFTPACHNMGLVLVQLRDTPDWVGAVGFFERAVAAGCVDSLACLGEYYDREGAEPARARDYFARAAAMGHSHALFTMGGFYEHGTHGLEIDPTRAADHYARAAATGYLPAVASLGVCYATSFGVEGDSVRALELFTQVEESQRDSESPITNFNMVAILGAWAEDADNAEAAASRYFCAAVNGIDWAFACLLELMGRGNWDARDFIQHLLEKSRSYDERVALIAARVLASVRKRCLGCGVTGRPPSRCSVCHSAKFCDRECFWRAWHVHKLVCCAPCAGQGEEESA